MNLFLVLGNDNDYNIIQESPHRVSEEVAGGPRGEGGTLAGVSHIRRQTLC